MERNREQCWNVRITEVISQNLTLFINIEIILSCIKQIHQILSNLLQGLKIQNLNFYNLLVA